MTEYMTEHRVRQIEETAEEMRYMLGRDIPAIAAELRRVSRDLGQYRRTAIPGVKDVAEKAIAVDRITARLDEVLEQHPATVSCRIECVEHGDCLARQLRTILREHGVVSRP